jgi:lysophospholipase L1-like esterase
MKAVLKNILFVTLPSLVFMFLLLELVFRFIIPAANQPDYMFDEKEQVLRFNNAKNTKGIFSTGKLAEHRYKWSINNAGWNSPYDYTTEKIAGVKRIAVIGDSYVEALNVNNTEMFAVRLNEQLGKNYQVYSFGISGSPFSQYLQMCRYAAKNYNPDIFIITLIHNDFDESLEGKSISPVYHTLKINTDSSVTEIPAQPYQVSTMRRLFKRSAFVRYLLFNIKIQETWQAFKAKWQTVEQPQNFNANIDVNAILNNKVAIQKAVDYICSSLKAEFPDKQFLLMIDGSRYDIYDHKLNECNVCYMNDMSMQAAQKYAMWSIDLNYLFEREYKKNKQVFNTPEDFHWNAYAHQLVADTLTQFITSK